ncbi:Uncharacterised protein [Mycobacteroides abscessus subsp. abscessus]|nr:Uncharacterised protein [Mycobacteroides abscessus subsp. abscessus]
MASLMVEAVHTESSACSLAYTAPETRSRST